MARSEWFGAVAVAICLVASTQVQAAPVRFTATLTGGQEVPPVATAAFGAASLELNDARDSLQMFISVFGLDFNGSTADTSDDVVGLHIHRAPTGANGPVVFGLINPDSDQDGDLTTFFNPLGGSLFSDWDNNAEGNGTTLAAEIGNLLNEGLYINVHTVRNPGGEIRGQIQVVPLPASLVLMLGALASLLPLGRRLR